jgi:hypothetical protein
VSAFQSAASSTAYNTRITRIMRVSIGSRMRARAWISTTVVFLTNGGASVGSRTHTHTHTHTMTRLHNTHEISLTHRHTHTHTHLEELYAQGNAAGEDEGLVGSDAHDAINRVCEHVSFEHLQHGAINKCVPAWCVFVMKGVVCMWCVCVSWACLCVSVCVGACTHTDMQMSLQLQIAHTCAQVYDHTHTHR